MVSIHYYFYNEYIGLYMHSALCHYMIIYFVACSYGKLIWL